MRKLLIAMIPLALLFPLAPTAPAQGATHEVAVVDFAFEDSATATPITVAAAGDTVVWTWAGAVPHTVTHGAAPALDGNAGGAFDSPRQTSGAYSHTFVEPGVYVYYCELHAAMRGIVVVQ